MPQKWEVATVTAGTQCQLRVFAAGKVTETNLPNDRADEILLHLLDEGWEPFDSTVLVTAAMRPDGMRPDIPQTRMAVMMAQYFRRRAPGPIVRAMRWLSRHLS
jgi:hypothetical protein